MGETAAQTLSEIETTRARLDGELRELERRLPAAAGVAKRAAAALVGVGALGAVTRFLLRRRRRHELRDIEKRVHRLERRLDDV